jgi:hypothetical protein
MYTCLASIKAAVGLAVTSAFVTGRVAGMSIFRSFSRNCSAAVWRIRDVYIPYPGSRIPDPDFYPSRIPDLGSKNSYKKNCCHTFFYSHKFNKIVKNYFMFEMLNKKILG